MVTMSQRLRRLQRSRLELSAGRTPSFITDCCNVCQALENSLVLVRELAHLRIFILRFTNVLIIIIIIILHRLWDGQILVENRRFNIPHLHLALPLGVTPFEFRQDLWRQKTRRIALSYGIKISPVGSLD